MKVVKVASTALEVNEGWDGLALHETGYITHPDEEMEQSSADELAEAAGRLCYLSFHRPNPATAENKDYLANIIRQRHFSVLEHASVTFYVAGVSRSLLLELERHRFLSFSVISQRYVDHSKAEFIEPPLLEEALDQLGDENREKFLEFLEEGKRWYFTFAHLLAKKGRTRKEARGAARSVLPEGTETKFFVTGNLRAWRDIIEKRNSVHADAEIREFAQEVLRQLKEYAPNTMQDME